MRVTGQVPFVLLWWFRTFWRKLGWKWTCCLKDWSPKQCWICMTKMLLFWSLQELLVWQALSSKRIKLWAKMWYVFYQGQTMTWVACLKFGSGVAFTRRRKDTTWWATPTLVQFILFSQHSGDGLEPHRPWRRRYHLHKHCQKIQQFCRPVPHRIPLLQARTQRFIGRQSCQEQLQINSTQS